MKVSAARLPGILLIDPEVCGDGRGFFIETWSLLRYAEVGVPADFVQDNVSRSCRGTLRGLHLQQPHAQAKLVQVLDGEIFDVAVDVRAGSPTFGQWVSAALSSANHRQIYIPAGFAHGFCVTSDAALFAYKCTDLYHPESEIGIAWDDPDLAIAWPTRAPRLSAKDGGCRAAARHRSGTVAAMERGCARAEIVRRHSPHGHRLRRRWSFHVDALGRRLDRMHGLASTRRKTRST